MPDTRQPMAAAVAPRTVSRWRARRGSASLDVSQHSPASAAVSATSEAVPTPPLSVALVCAGVGALVGEGTNTARGRSENERGAGASLVAIFATLRCYDTVPGMSHVPSSRGPTLVHKGKQNVLVYSLLGMPSAGPGPGPDPVLVPVRLYSTCTVVALRRATSVGSVPHRNVIVGSGCALLSHNMSPFRQMAEEPRPYSAAPPVSGMAPFSSAGTSPRSRVLASASPSPRKWDTSTPSTYRKRPSQVMRAITPSGFSSSIGGSPPRAAQLPPTLQPPPITLNAASSERKLLQKLTQRTASGPPIGTGGQGVQSELQERWAEQHAWCVTLSMNLEGACQRIESLVDENRNLQRLRQEDENTMRHLQYRASLKNVASLEQTIQTLQDQIGVLGLEIEKRGKRIDAFEGLAGGAVSGDSPFLPVAADARQTLCVREADASEVDTLRQRLADSETARQDLAMRLMKAEESQQKAEARAIAAGAAAAPPAATSRVSASSDEAQAQAEPEA